MPRLALALLGLAAPVLAAGAASAQNAQPAGQRPAESPDVTVQGPDRMVCRLVRRTGTRMRSSRVCRTVSQWQEAVGGRSQDEVLAEAADSLEMHGDKVSTNCVGAELTRENGRTPHGPR